MTCITVDLSVHALMLSQPYGEAVWSAGALAAVALFIFIAL